MNTANGLRRPKEEISTPGEGTGFSHLPLFDPTNPFCLTGWSWFKSGSARCMSNMWQCVVLRASGKPLLSYLSRKSAEICTLDSSCRELQLPLKYKTWVSSPHGCILKKAAVCNSAPKEIHAELKLLSYDYFSGTVEMGEELNSQPLCSLG